MYDDLAKHNIKEQGIPYSIPAYNTECWISRARFTNGHENPTVQALWNLYGNPYRKRVGMEEETVTWGGFLGNPASIKRLTNHISG